jgi:hypothetical protein
MEEKIMLNTKKTIRTALALLLSVLLAVSLVSCAAGAEADSMNNAYDKDISYDKSEDGMGSFSPMPEIAPSEPEAVPPTADGAGSSSGEVKEEYQTKIIRTVTQRAQTKAFDAAIAGIEALVTQHGGYVESSYVHGIGYNNTGRGSRSAEYTIRIPAEKLDVFLTEAGGLYAVTYNNSSVSNVTAQYYDIVTRLQRRNKGAIKVRSHRYGIIIDALDHQAIPCGMRAGVFSGDHHAMNEMRFIRIYLCTFPSDGMEKLASRTKQHSKCQKGTVKGCWTSVFRTRSPRHHPSADRQKERQSNYDHK